MLSLEASVHLTAESEGCCKVSTAGLSLRNMRVTPAGLQPSTLDFFSQKSTEKGKLNNAEKSAAAPSRPKLWCHNNLSSVNEGSKFNIL